MNINDILLRRDLPINAALVIISVVICLTAFNQVNRESAKLKTDTTAQIEKNKLLQEVKTISTDIQTVRKGFWEDSSLIFGELYDQLQRKLQELDAYDILITIERIENKAAYGVVPIKAAFKLDYKTALGFFKYIEENQKILKLQHAGMKKSSVSIEDENKRLDIEVMLHAYCLKE